MKNRNDVKPGQRVIVTQLESTDGMLIAEKNMQPRRIGATGTVAHHVPGHGGDVWIVQHEDSDDVAAYCFTEFEPTDTFMNTAWTIADLRATGHYLPDGCTVNGVTILGGSQVLADFDSAKALIELRPAVERLEALVQDRDTEIARRNQILLRGLHYGPDTGGALDMKLGGENATIFMAVLADFFFANGGKNYLTLTLEAAPRDGGKAIHLEVTIRNCDGKMTPAEEINQLKRLLEYIEENHIRATSPRMDGTFEYSFKVGGYIGRAGSFQAALDAKTNEAR